jgi:uncharacterized protein involved in oxidation of intracellular sulfur
MDLCFLLYLKGIISAVFGVNNKFLLAYFTARRCHRRTGEMMEYLLVLNDSPYGSQRTYNALRLAGALAKGAPSQVSLFLLGDGVVSGLRRQAPSDASYNVQEMLRLLAEQGISIAACRTCLEARGIDDGALVAGVKRRTLDDLRTWTEEATKVLVF